MSFREEESRILESLVLAHRYLYYVDCSPVISDYEYDVLEREAREKCGLSSPVHGIGSSLPSSYSPETVLLAKSLE